MAHSSVGMKRKAHIDPETWQEMQEQDVEDQEQELLEWRVLAADLMAEKRELLDMLAESQAVVQDLLRKTAAYADLVHNLKQDLQEVQDVLAGMPAFQDKQDAQDQRDQGARVSSLSALVQDKQEAEDQQAKVSGVSPAFQEKQEAEDQQARVSRVSAALLANHTPSILDDQQDAQCLISLSLGYEGFPDTARS
ncbi:unnamed protein product [Symbiodinium sp. CCMP2592]|nr:unnamed protein product [Symbiodinium sp. CCMP2592]